MCHHPFGERMIWRDVAPKLGPGTGTGAGYSSRRANAAFKHGEGVPAFTGTEERSFVIELGGYRASFRKSRSTDLRRSIMTLRIVKWTLKLVHHYRVPPIRIVYWVEPASLSTVRVRGRIKV